VLEVAAVQVALQTPAAVSQRYGSHSDAVTAWQTPAPSHMRGGVRDDPVQAAAAHCVPEA
jgi:hypothetical protein